jgi:hypothetical protein
MNESTFLGLLGVGLLLLAGCDDEPRHAQPEPLVTTTNAAPSGSVAPANAKTTKGNKPSDEQRATLLRHLNKGRELAKKADYKTALAELDKALALAPQDPRVLAEIGWAAFKAGDLARAKDANKKALAATSDTKLRAQILYNIGRVAEEQKDTEAALRAYRDSLALRDNAEVKKRFEALGGSADDLARAWSTCNEGFDSTTALCACLTKNAEALLSLPDSPSCAIAKSPKLSQPELSLAELKNDAGTSVTTVLVARDGATLRAVAELGEVYEPGAVGVHNAVEILGSEVKTVSKRRIAIVKSRESHADFNMAGLELLTHDSENHLLCVLGDGKAPTTCPQVIPVKVESSYGLGAELDPKEMDAETAALAAEIKANSFEKNAKVDYTLDDRGKLSVKLAEGEASLVPANVLGDFSLLGD